VGSEVWAAGGRCVSSKSSSFNATKSDHARPNLSSLYALVRPSIETVNNGLTAATQSPGTLTLSVERKPQSGHFDGELTRTDLAQRYRPRRQPCLRSAISAGDTVCDPHSVHVRLLRPGRGTCLIRQRTTVEVKYQPVELARLANHLVAADRTRSG
jgi:hypothetical protein